MQAHDECYWAYLKVSVPEVVGFSPVANKRQPKVSRDKTIDILEPEHVGFHPFLLCPPITVGQAWYPQGPRSTFPFPLICYALVYVEKKHKFWRRLKDVALKATLDALTVWMLLCLFHSQN